MRRIIGNHVIKKLKLHLFASMYLCLLRRNSYEMVNELMKI